MYVNNGGVKSRGVAILVKRGVVENVTKCVDDGDGRVIGITFEHLGKICRLLNVYAPNEEKERRVFFEGLGGMCVENCVVVGDFNVWCGRLDASTSVCFSNDSSRGFPDSIRLAAHWRPTSGRVGGPTGVPTGGPLEFCSSVPWWSVSGSKAAADKGPPLCRF
uniref:Endonuclease/exonuclease/phosphatase domain-containing protein n=1 Tax=Gadus morhua TaxID=8049 RepID=A0A8C5AJN6_GADMO